MDLTIEFGDLESRKDDEASSCAGKVRYGHRETALRACQDMRAKGRDLEPYPCPYCNGWHLGHRLPRWLRWLFGKARGRQ